MRSQGSPVFSLTNHQLTGCKSGSHVFGVRRTLERVDIAPVTPEGAHVTLVPLTTAHRPALCAVGLDPELWDRTTIRVRTPGDMQQVI
jgi:hypothetical protein